MRVKKEPLQGPEGLGACTGHGCPSQRLWSVTPVPWLLEWVFFGLIGPLAHVLLTGSERSIEGSGTPCEQ